MGCCYFPASFVALFPFCGDVSLHLKLQPLISGGSVLFDPDAGRLAVDSRTWGKVTEAATFTKEKGRRGLVVCFYFIF